MEDKHPKSYEQVIMQVKSKTASSTILEIGRKKIEQVDEKMHVAGGQHTGIVINKGAAIGKLKDRLKIRMDISNRSQKIQLVHRDLFRLF